MSSGVASVPPYRVLEESNTGRGKQVPCPDPSHRPSPRPVNFRHRRVTKWLAEGASVVHVQAAVGHANIATTMKYTHLADEHVDALLEHEARGKFVARPAANA